MAHSYFSESDAPRDFRISSTESDSNYTKCALCYTMKKNFYCVECIRSGNILHSSMPYSDRFVEKQAKLQRLKANRKYVQDRCESLLVPRNKHAKLQTELKTCRNKIELIKLAIEQRRNNIVIKKQELDTLRHSNSELAAKLPRYQKRVASMGKHVLSQEIKLQNQMVDYEEKEQALAALRRERIRQLTKYIFPVYITYDTSDSLEDMEFLQAEDAEGLAGGVGGVGGVGGAGRERIHVISAWLPAQGDLPDTYSPQVPVKDGECESALRRARAALCLFAQLVTLLAWTLDTSVPATTPTSHTRGEVGYSPASLCRRVCACCVRVCVCAGVCPLSPPHVPPPSPPLAALMLLHDLLTAANVDDTNIGRVNMCLSSSGALAAEEWSALVLVSPHRDRDHDAEPEHIEWHASELPPPGAGVCVCVAESPPLPAASLVTSAAASIASIWRGWTK